MRTKEEIENRFELQCFECWFTQPDCDTISMAAYKLMELAWLLNIPLDIKECYDRGEAIWKAGYKFEWDGKEFVKVKR